MCWHFGVNRPQKHRFYKPSSHKRSPAGKIFDESAEIVPSLSQQRREWSLSLLWKTEAFVVKATGTLVLLNKFLLLPSSSPSPLKNHFTAIRAPLSCRSGNLTTGMTVIHRSVEI